MKTFESNAQRFETVCFPIFKSFPITKKSFQKLSLKLIFLQCVLFFKNVILQGKAQIFADILAGFTFNNRVLRLPAIVLLNTTFRPGNSGLLRVYVQAF